MEQDTDPDSPDDPTPPAKGSGLFYKDGTEIPPTHPDHGPMHLLPRQEDGSFAAYYYCSKAELYDMRVNQPPPRRHRRDGFSLERQEQFLEHVRGGASGREAARRVGISPTTAYNLYNSPDGAAFRAGWDEAARVTDIVLEDTAFDRAVNGQEEVVFHQGQRVGTRWKYDNNLLMKLLRARNPLKYAPLSEIEGWLRHRGIAPPADVEGALDRLRESEAEWGRRLPGEEPPARLENEGATARPGLSRSVRPEPVEGPSVLRATQEEGASTGSARTEAALDEAGEPSTSSTSSEEARAERSPAASTSFTSPGDGQCEGAPASPDPSTSSTSPGNGQAEGAPASPDPSTSSTSPGSGQPDGGSPGADEPSPPEEPQDVRPPPQPRITLL